MAEIYTLPNKGNLNFKLLFGNHFNLGNSRLILSYLFKVITSFKVNGNMRYFEKEIAYYLLNTFRPAPLII